MQAEGELPKINSGLIQQFVGRTVSVVGKVTSPLGQQTAQIESSDGGMITVNTNGEESYGSEYVEIIGQVNDDASIQQFKFTDFGSDFDLGMYNKVVQMSNGKFNHLFASN